MTSTAVIDRATCPLPLAAPLSSREADRLASWLGVLADPARLRMVSLIAAQPDHEICVCNLTEPLRLTQPTVSHHLKVLMGAGLLDREQRGRWAYYRIRFDALTILAGALTPQTRRR